MSRYGRDVDEIAADIERAKQLASTFSDWDVIDAMEAIKRNRSQA